MPPLPRTSVSILVSTLIILLLQHCPTQPDDPDPAEPGRRDYVWTVDTLTVPYNDTFHPRRMWGSAADDVWLVGRGSTTRLLWHFDGTEWQTDSVYRAISPSALWGFASDDIWLGNWGNVFWHYDGYSWSKYGKVTPPEGYDITSIEGLWGSNPSSVWGVGFATNLTSASAKGIIMHFDGSQWDYKSIPSLPVAFIRIRKQRSSQQLFVQGQRTAHVPRDTFKVYTYDGNKSLDEIYSEPSSMVIWDINGSLCFVSEQKIYTYKKNKFVLWKDFSNENYVGWMVGRSAKDFFGVGAHGDIVRYNGTDLATLYSNTISVWNLFVIENSVFYVCKDIETGINKVIHGELLDK